MDGPNLTKPALDDGASAWPEQLAVRIAWCYYALGLTQQEIAERLHITRVKVNRLLAEARRRGVVRITITSKLAENVELEERLKTRFDLADARVVLGTDDERDLAELLGRVGAEIYSDQIVEGQTIGIGWGITLKAFATAMPEHPLTRACVVAMLGSLTRRSSIDAFEAATQLAQKLHAECFYMPGPLICDSKNTRQAFGAQPLMHEVFERAHCADLAIVSVGGVESGTIRQVGLIEDDQLKSVQNAGAVGNFLGHYIDGAAQIVDHPINKRVLGIRPDALRDIERRVMISGGAMKIPALRAILNAGLLTEIVTDQDSARSLLDDT
ncbi:MAG: sugar-binding transcriptional regulator [Pseudomonadota bacterium]